jgi:hypothetical protein
MCTSCAVGTYSVIGSSNCEPCSTGWSNVGSGNSECERCTAGTFATVGGGCEACDTSGYSDTAEATECKQCPENSLTVTGGSTSIDACLCTRGWGQSSDGGDCYACVGGTYKDGWGVVNCGNCPPGSASELAVNSGDCIPCDVNTYSSIPGASAITCTPCVIGTTTLGNDGSISSDACVCGEDHLSAHTCAAGYVSDMTYCITDRWPCKPCAIGTYNTMAGMDVCYNCPVGMTTSTTGSIGVDSCVCTGVYSGDFAPALPEQNHEFLELLNTKKPSFVNLFSQYNAETKTVPDLMSNPSSIGRVARILESSVVQEYPALDMSDSVWVFTSTQQNDRFIYRANYEDPLPYNNGYHEVEVSSSSSTDDGGTWMCLVGVPDVRYSWLNSYNHLGQYKCTTFTSEPGVGNCWSSDSPLEYKGDWIRITYPAAFIPKKIKFDAFDPSSDLFSLPGAFKLYGYNGYISDSSIWDIIYTQNSPRGGDSTGDGPDDDFILDNDKPYTNLLLVVSQLYGEDNSQSNPNVNEATRALSFEKLSVVGTPNLARLTTNPAGDTYSNAENPVTCLTGDQELQIQWDTPYPQWFTMCWVTRYNGMFSQDTTGRSIGNILQDGFGGLFGHGKNVQPGFVKNMFNAEGLIDTWGWVPEESDDSKMKWLIECFSNIDDESTIKERETIGRVDTVVIDQTFVGRVGDNSEFSQDAVNWKAGDRTLNINIPHEAANMDIKSDFQVHSVYGWNEFLSGVEMKVVTAALRRELGGTPYTESTNVEPLHDLEMYTQRIIAATKSTTVPVVTCTFQYPPASTRTQVLTGPEAIQYSHIGGRKHWFDMTGEWHAYATGTYIVEYSSGSSDPDKRPLNLLFDQSMGTTESVFGENEYYCDSTDSSNPVSMYSGENHLVPNRIVVDDSGDWIQITSPESFQLTHYEIDATTSLAAPGRYTIYGLNSDTVQWDPILVNVWESGRIVVGSQTKRKYYTYALVVHSLGNCETYTMKFDAWKLWGVSCAAGKYADNSNQGLCTACPLGQYSTARGRTSCVQCPHDMTTEQIGSTSLVACVHRTALCVPGYYCSVQPQGVDIDVIANGHETGGYSMHVVNDSVGSLFLVHNFTHVSGELQKIQTNTQSGNMVYTPYTIRISNTKPTESVLVVDVLIVGGGGGGGGGQTWGCGGAGGGGAVKFISDRHLSSGSMIVLRVGAGGKGSAFNAVNAADNVDGAENGGMGASSVFGDDFVPGGGGGGSVSSSTYSEFSRSASNGGVGCAKHTSFTGSLSTGGACVGTGTGTTECTTNMAYCGGGGGAGGAATDPVNPCASVIRSVGGPGLSFHQFGGNVDVGGGGSGTGRDYVMGGASHGGGIAPFMNGLPHTGGGGVGGGGSSIEPTSESGMSGNGASGNGASGSVLLRYPLSICTPCPVGTFSASTDNNLECTQCPVGTFASRPGSIICIPCPAGTSVSHDRTSCTPCEPGSYVPDVPDALRDVYDVAGRDIMRDLVLYAPYDVDFKDYSGHGVVETLAPASGSDMYISSVDPFVGVGGLYSSSGINAAGINYGNLAAVDIVQKGFSFSFFFRVDYQDIHVNSNNLMSFVGTTTYNAVASDTLRVRVYLNVNNRLGVQVRIGSDYFNANVGIYTIGSRVHFAFSVEYTPEIRVKTWMDGVIWANDEQVLLQYDSVLFTMLVLGGSNGVDNPEEIYVDDVRVYGRALSQDDVDVLSTMRYSLPAPDNTSPCAEVCDDVSEQNAAFLELLQKRPPVGINIFSQYDPLTKTVPDMRGNGYDVVVRGQDPVSNFLPDSGTFTKESEFAGTYTVTDQLYGNGVYEIEFSSDENYNDCRSPLYLLVPPTHPDRQCASTHWSPHDAYTAETGVYTGTNTLDGSYFGDWFKVKLPVCFTLKQHQMKTQASGWDHRAPGTYKIYARMYDSDPWVVILSQDSVSVVDEWIQSHPTARCYLQYAFCANTLRGASDRMTMETWKLHGIFNPLQVLTTPAGMFNAANDVTSLRGGVAMNVDGVFTPILTWPAALPETFSLCFVTRSTGGNSPVLGCTGTDGVRKGFFGHSSSGVWGSIYYNEKLRTQEATVVNSPNDWLVMCVTNGFSSTSNTVHDQEDRGIEDILMWPAPTCTLDVNIQAVDNGFEVHSVYLWDVSLTNIQMKTVTRALRKEIGGIPFNEIQEVVPIRDLRLYHMRFLLVMRPPKSINIFSDFDGTTVTDRMGNGIDVTLTGGEASLVTASYNGANNVITALAGTPDTKLLWPIDSIPASMTICSVSRYIKAGGRILSTHSSPGVDSRNDIFGHHAGNRGVMLYWNNWITVHENVGIRTDWLVMCSSNGGSPLTNILIDQTSVGVMDITSTRSARLNVNYLQGSDFEIHSVYIWDSVLTAGQMKLVTAALRAEIGGIPDFGTVAVAPLPTPAHQSAQCIVCVKVFTSTTGMTTDVAGCLPSPIGSFVALPGSTSHRPCPLNMTTLGSGKTSLSDCVCKSGLYMDPYGFCVDCTPGSTSPVNGKTYDACTCSSTGSYKGSSPVASCGVLVSAGQDHTCVLFSDIGKVKCWGSNEYGQIMTGYITVAIGDEPGEMGVNLPFVDFGENPPVKALATGSDHSCVLFVNGRMKCAGRNIYGQLGLGDSMDRGNTVAYLQDTTYETGFVNIADEIISMHLGDSHTCVMLLYNNQVKCFGNGRNGRLGYGDTMSHGRLPDQMNDFLPAVEFGENRYAVRLFNSGGSTMCALMNTAELLCWGGNYEFVLGNGISKDRYIGGNAGEMGDNLIAINLPTGRTVVNLWVTTHVVIIMDDHSMTAWGRCGGYMCGNTLQGHVGGHLSDMGNNLKIIDTGTMRIPVQVLINWRVTIILFNTGEVGGFGNNEWESLGPGVVGKIGTASEMGDGMFVIDFGTGIKVKGLANHAFRHFCMVTETEEVVCWG